jgi:hypothetical protein
MLSLFPMPMLTEVCVPFNVWGSTSLAHLWLLAADDCSPWLVCITAIPSEGHRIQYKTVEAEEPRPEASVEGVASDEATAWRIILRRDETLWWLD